VKSTQELKQTEKRLENSVTKLVEVEEHLAEIIQMKDSKEVEAKLNEYYAKL